MVVWHHPPNGHEIEQTLGDSEGQGSQLCCSPWGHKESDMTEQPNNNNTPLALPGPRPIISPTPVQVGGLDCLSQDPQGGLSPDLLTL